MLSLASLSVTSCKAHFLVRKQMQLQQQGDRSYILHDLQGVRSPGPLTTARIWEEERPSAPEKSLSQLSPQRWSSFLTVCIPDPQKKKRGLGLYTWTLSQPVVALFKRIRKLLVSMNLTLWNTINTIHCITQINTVKHVYGMQTGTYSLVYYVCILCNQLGQVFYLTIEIL